MEENNFVPPIKAAELNENEEWVEVSLENVLPKWMIENLCEEDEDEDIAFVYPYLQEEFKEWLLKERVKTEKSAEDYLRAYESAYESLYERVGIDLYNLLDSFLVEIPEITNSDSSKKEAPGLVQEYIEAMQEALDENEDAYTKAEIRALLAYHGFIVEISGSADKKLLKEKSTPLPDEDEFLSWLDTEYKMNYENARKVVSSVKRMNLILPSMVSEPMSFLDVLRALRFRSKRNNYIQLVSKKKKEIIRNAGCSYKTLMNGFVNIKYYVNFLNSKI